MAMLSVQLVDLIATSVDKVLNALARRRSYDSYVLIHRLLNSVLETSGVSNWSMKEHDS